MTPEGRVKKLVRDYIDVELTSLLTEKGYDLYTIRFVPTGYGRNNQLDITLCIAGHMVIIETKAPGKWLTPLQINACADAYRSGASVFIISGSAGLEGFKTWVRNNERYWHA
jgi:hypothetical protein